MVSHLEQQLGPFDESEIRAKWEAGELLPIDYVYVEAKQDWILLSEQFPWATVRPKSTLEVTSPRINLTATQLSTPTQANIDFPAAPPPISERKAPRRTIETLATSVTATAEPVAPAVTSQMAQPAQVAKVEGAQVKLVDGVGEIKLSPLPPGHVEVGLQDASATSLKLQNPLKINVKAAEPVELVWAFPMQQTCGQDIEIMMKALDENGHICEHFDDQFTVKVAAVENRDIPVRIEKGQAVLKFQNTKAETWSISIQYSGARRLRLPEARQFEWQPGPATRLVLDGPQEYLAGHPLKVQVKAVDAFGNLAKTFQGTVILEVKAS